MGRGGARPGAGRKPKADGEAPPLRLEWRDPAELADNPRNWRRHPPAQMQALAAAVAEVGWAGACLYNERTGRLIDGHARKALEGVGPVPVLVGSWDEATEAKILATLDPLAAMASADAAALDALLRDVQTGDAALANMLAGLAEANPVVPPLPTPGGGGDDFDATPAEDGPCRVQKGDLWLIDGGRHRLVCGDATDAHDVARAMGGEKAAAIVTDPPYPAEFGHVWDALGKPAFDVCEDSATLTTFCGHYQVPRVLQAVLAGGWEWFWLAVAANQNQPIMHGYSVKCCFKPCLVFRKGGLAPSRIWYDNFALRTKTADWEEAQAAHKWGQAAALFYEPVDAFTAPDALLLDPFAGGGTTLLVARRTGRRSASVEIEPRYCEVILRRCEAEGMAVEKAG